MANGNKKTYKYVGKKDLGAVPMDMNVSVPAAPRRAPLLLRVAPSRAAVARRGVRVHGCLAGCLPVAVLASGGCRWCARANAPPRRPAARANAPPRAPRAPRRPC